MAIDLETYYYFIGDTGLIPLWEELYELDKYPALRYALIMEQIHCEELAIKSYNKPDGLDELSYSKDMHQGISDDILLEKLRIDPVKKNEFLTITIKIEAQKCIYIKNSDYFQKKNKLDYSRSILKALQIRRMFEPSMIDMSNELVKYLENSITELETVTELGSRGNNEAPGKTIKPPKEAPTFESFFIDQDMIKPLIEFLSEEIIISSSGKWIGKKKRKTDLMGFIDALHARDLIQFENQVQIGTAFYKKFKLNINIRSLTLSTDIRDDAREEYLELLDDFRLDYGQKDQPKIAK